MGLARWFDYDASDDDKKVLGRNGSSKIGGPSVAVL
jgi:hypothetical protein